MTHHLGQWLLRSCSVTSRWFLWFIGRAGSWRSTLLSWLSRVHRAGWGREREALGLTPVFQRIKFYFWR